MHRSRLAAICIGIAALIVFITPGSALARQGASVSRQAAAPVFSFPTNGTSYPSNGPYVFQAQPLSGAKGYLWSFVQNGMVVYQNLAWDGHLSPANYTVATNSKAHSLIHPGDLHVWVRALMKNGQWSATGAVLVRIQGKGRASPTPAPKPSNLLYQADWSNGMNGWSGSAGWTPVSGMLVSNGTNDTPILAPYRPTTADYAVEAVVRIDNVASVCGPTYFFSLIVRLSQAGYYNAGYSTNCGADSFISAVDTTNSPNNNVSPIDRHNYTTDPGHSWHTYKLVVQANQITLYLDNAEVASASDNRYLDPGQVGLEVESTQVSVRSFKVLKL